jgi:hypothetical protein
MTFFRKSTWVRISGQKINLGEDREDREINLGEDRGIVASAALKLGNRQQIFG